MALHVLAYNLTRVMNIMGAHGRDQGVRRLLGPEPVPIVSRHLTRCRFCTTKTQPRHRVRLW